MCCLSHMTIALPWSMSPVLLRKYRNKSDGRLAHFVLSVDEWKDKLKMGNAFIARVMNSEKIFLIGWDDDLKRLQRNGWLKAHNPTVQEVTDLLTLADRDLRNAKAKGLDDDWRFSIAYNAILQAGTAALIASGYSVPKGDSHHFRVIGSMAFTLGLEPDLLDKLDRYRKRRSMSIYDVAGVITPTESKDMRTVATDIVGQVHEWLEQKYPGLVKQRNSQDDRERLMAKRFTSRPGSNRRFLFSFPSAEGEFRVPEFHDAPVEAVLDGEGDEGGSPAFLFCIGRRPQTPLADQAEPVSESMNMAFLILCSRSSVKRGKSSCF